MNLAHVVKTAISITSETEVLSYTYSGTHVLQVISRAVLGDNTHPIAGNGIYSLRVYLNNTLVTPTTDDPVPSGTTSTMVVSRPVPMVTGDLISIRVVGQVADTTVDTVADLYDSTSVTMTDIEGSGTVIVDHNYSGANTFTYQTSTGAGIGGATILIFLQSDYNAGLRSTDYMKARTTTKSDGTWVNAVSLQVGSTYTLVFYRQGSFGPDLRTLAL